MPRPAVIHCTSPAPSAPRLPRLSPCSTVPASTYVMVSMPRCGCHGKPARKSAGRSLRKSSNSRNGSKSPVFPNPNARRSFTPAPSTVGVAWMIRLIGRMDMALPPRSTTPGPGRGFPAEPLRGGVPGNQFVSPPSSSTPMYRLTGLIGLLALLPGTLSSQAPDTAYMRLVREATSDPRFLPASVATVPDHPTIPSPRDHFGTITGAVGVMHRSAELYAYYRALAAATPRVRVETVGRTEEGRE